MPGEPPIAQSDYERMRAYRERDRRLDDIQASILSSLEAAHGEAHAIQPQAHVTDELARASATMKIAKDLDWERAGVTGKRGTLYQVKGQIQRLLGIAMKQRERNYDRLLGVTKAFEGLEAGIAQRDRVIFSEVEDKAMPGSAGSSSVGDVPDTGHSKQQLLAPSMPLSERSSFDSTLSDRDSEPDLTGGADDARLLDVSNNINNSTMSDCKQLVNTIPAEQVALSLITPLGNEMHITQLGISQQFNACTLISIGTIVAVLSAEDNDLAIQDAIRQSFTRAQAKFQQLLARNPSIATGMLEAEAYPYYSKELSSPVKVSLEAPVDQNLNSLIDEFISARDSYDGDLEDFELHGGELLIPLLAFLPQDQDVEWEWSTVTSDVLKAKLRPIETSDESLEQKIIKHIGSLKPQSGMTLSAAGHTISVTNKGGKFYSFDSETGFLAMTESVVEIARYLNEYFTRKGSRFVDTYVFRKLSPTDDNTQVVLSEVGDAKVGNLTLSTVSIPQKLSTSVTMVDRPIQDAPSSDMIPVALGDKKGELPTSQQQQRPLGTDTSIIIPSSDEKTVLQKHVSQLEQSYEHDYKSKYGAGFWGVIKVFFRNKNRADELTFLKAVSENAVCTDAILLDAIQLVHDKIANTEYFGKAGLFGGGSTLRDRLSATLAQAVPQHTLDMDRLKTFCDEQDIHLPEDLNIYIASQSAKHGQ